MRDNAADDQSERRAGEISADDYRWMLGFSLLRGLRDLRSAVEDRSRTASGYKQVDLIILGANGGI